jgi:ABC-type multidrug transport system fused ATPase/permease subunit
MLILVDTLAIIFISLTLMATIPFVVLGCGLIFAAGSVLLILPVRHLGNKTGKEINGLMGELNKCAYYSLEDVKTIKISGTAAYFSRVFSRLRHKRSKCDSTFYLLGQVPRLVLELLAVISAVTMLLIMLGRGVPMGTVILSFSLLIAAMSRLLPSFSRIHYALNSIRIGYPMLKDIMDALQWEKENLGDTSEPMVFQNELKVENLTFSYPGSTRKIFSDLNFTLKRNTSLAIVGPTGGGKSTLVDLLLGFYTPDGGKILVDGKNIYEHLGAWRKLVGFVPQFIVLADASVAANVAVGVEEDKIDRARVREVLRIAQMEQFIDALPQGMDTVIGDNGMRLSGGQRQRLGIARALYRDPEVIIFDEATSALDTETEEALINAVETLHGSKTLIMVAHRLSTVEKCDLRVEIKPEDNASEH